MSNAPRTQRFRTVLDAPAMAQIIARMAARIVADAGGDDGGSGGDLEALVLVGIRTRGLPLAERLADEIETRTGARPPLGALDITLYRDDLSTVGPQPVVRGTELPGSSVEDRTIVLCDDVLFTGRTVRAALDELNDYGRPRAVRLAVLIDRGHRELPIQADVVGHRLETARDELVEVGFEAVDGSDHVRLLGAGGEAPEDPAP